MRIALRQEVPSPESELVCTGLRRAGHDVVVLGPWSIEAYTETFDVAVCLGPVGSCPLAVRRVLVVLGMTATHHDLCWDAIVATSAMGRRLAMAKFGYRPRLAVISPPVLDLAAGRRRIVERKRGLIHVSECAAARDNHVVRMLVLWGEKELPCPEDKSRPPWLLPLVSPEYWFMQTPAKPRSNRVAFSTLEFNSLVRGGAIGFYPGWMEDGYDIQVRRHLALGGSVFCPCHRDVLSEDVAVHCLDLRHPLLLDEAHQPDSPVPCAGDAESYLDELTTFLRL